jgi:hypothetical protein
VDYSVAWSTPADVEEYRWSIDGGIDVVSMCGIDVVSMVSMWYRWYRCGIDGIDGIDGVRLD